MLHQRFKDIVFYGIGFYSFLARPFLRIKFRNSKNFYINVGCGEKGISGFINIDANPLRPKILLYDVRLKLPFSDDSATIIYVSNILEHFYLDELANILKEFRRIMRPGGILRIVVPDLEKSISSYIQKDSQFFSDFPRNFKSIGGRFVNLIFCDSQHKTAFDFNFIKELLAAVGFSSKNIYKKSYGQSLMAKEIYARIAPQEEHYKNRCLFIEAIK
ncbi:MAG: methyltransferase domain-containing protein [Patescibacteria group bacterium]